MERKVTNCCRAMANGLHSYLAKPTCAFMDPIRRQISKKKSTLNTPIVNLKDGAKTLPPPPAIKVGSGVPGRRRASLL